MTYTPPGNEPQQPYSAPQQPQQSQYSTPQYDVGQSGGYTGYATPAPKPKSDKKTLGLWALILGISSIIIPLGLNGVAGVGLGIAGLIKENSKGMSIGGIVTGAIGIIWAPIAWSLIAFFVTLAAVGTQYDY